MGCGSKQPMGLEYLLRLKAQAAKGIGTARGAKMSNSQRGKSLKQQREWKWQRGISVEHLRGLE